MIRFCVVCLLALPREAVARRRSGGVVNVVLVGATGDLSKKYLWQALFRLHMARFKAAAACPPARGGIPQRKKRPSCHCGNLKKHLVCKPGSTTLDDDHECRDSKFHANHVTHSRLKRHYAQLNLATDRPREHQCQGGWPHCVSFHTTQGIRKRFSGRG